jgi:hypothetical protein
MRDAHGKRRPDADDFLDERLDERQVLEVC